MSTKTRIAALALATLAIAGSIASTSPAQASGGWGYGPGWGIGAGLVGAAIVGSAIAASNDGYYSRLSPPRLGSPVRCLRQLHRSRSHLRLLIAALPVVEPASGAGASSTRAVPDPPDRPPGGSTFSGSPHYPGHDGRLV